MKKQIAFILCIIVIASAVYFLPSNATTSTFKQIAAGDQITWTVTDYNETNNLVEATDWNDVNYMRIASYSVNIGDNVTFLVGDPSACSGTFKIGNLTLETARVELGLNLMAITGPKYVSVDYEFNPALLCPTNWETQISNATNAAAERSGATMIIGSSYKIFMGFNRSVISFNFTWFGQDSRTIYDNETGILLYLYAKYQLFWIEMRLESITPKSEIPAFEGLLAAFIILGITLVLYSIKKKQKIPLN